MATKRLQNRPPTKLTAEQKIAAALLTFLGLGGVFFGFQSFGANLARPIHQQLVRDASGPSLRNQDADEQANIAALKIKDTDGDTLTDYDELYVYKTSAYLTDSDSDGFGDKEEVMSGNDPNCPKGKVCGVGDVATEDSTSMPDDAEGLLSASSSAPTSNSTGSGIDSSKLKFNSKAEIEAFFRKTTIPDIRDSLVKLGKLTKLEVDQMSDVDLRASFDQAIIAASNSGAFDSMLSTKDSTQPLLPIADTTSSN